MVAKATLNADLDYEQLKNELGRTKLKLFMTKDRPTFFGSLMSNLAFIWSSDIKTAQTNGITICWNPYWFMRLPPETRVTVLLHELWHVALMHPLRCMLGMYDPEVHNIACDIWINWNLQRQGYTFDGTRPQWWQSYPFQNESVEVIYENLMANAKAIFDQLSQQIQMAPPDEVMAGDDLCEPDSSEGEDINDVLGSIVQARQKAQMQGEESLDQEVETLLNQFLQPKIAWESIMFRWFDAKIEQDVNWRKRNRRYADMYMPGMEFNEGLQNLYYFFDISSSVSQAMVTRFNSELKYIKTVFNPEKITLILFNTGITQIFEMKAEDEFTDITMNKGGGTSLTEVHAKIIEDRPDAVIIFSDLECNVMDEVKDIPILWIVVNNPSATVNSGEMIHIRE